MEDVGSEVPGLKSGDLVVAPFVWSDGTGEFCREGLQTSCSAREGIVDTQWGSCHAPGSATRQRRVVPIIDVV